jgi:hypothetical protein
MKMYDDGVLRDQTAEEVAATNAHLLSVTAEDAEAMQLERIRNVRNALLSQSDYTQLPDSPVDKDLWVIYRQKLRDLPSTVDINNPIYPEQPQ